ncbi:hypothetical protein Efla_006705 [Eimeria flavescens]
MRWAWSPLRELCGCTTASTPVRETRKSRLNSCESQWKKGGRLLEEDQGLKVTGLLKPRDYVVSCHLGRRETDPAGAPGGSAAISRRSIDSVMHARAMRVGCVEGTMGSRLSKPTVQPAPFGHGLEPPGAQPLIRDGRRSPTLRRSRREAEEDHRGRDQVAEARSEVSSLTAELRDMELLTSQLQGPYRLMEAELETLKRHQQLWLQKRSRHEENMHRLLAAEAKAARTPSLEQQVEELKGQKA